MEWCTEFVNIIGQVDLLIKALQQGQVYIVSDGSYVQPFATAAFVMENETRECRVTNRIIAPGSGEEMSAYRGEVSGILASLFFVNHLCSFFHIQMDSITMGCDGEGALYQSFHEDTPRSIDTPSFDLLMAIHRYRSRSSLRWQTTWIKGHQEDNTVFDKLDRLSQLNIWADKLAKSMIPIARTRRRHYHVEGAPWYVGHDGKRVSNLSSHLYEIVHLPAAFTFWKIKDKANGTPLEFINWESIGKALSALPRTRQHFVCKHTVGMCGVGKWMLRWKEWTSAQCPRCGMLEDASHVWKCQGKDANIVWEQALGSLQEWLASVQTDPDITSALCNGLKTWRLGQEFRPIITYIVPPCNREILVGVICWKAG